MTVVKVANSSGGSDLEKTSVFSPENGAGKFGEERESDRDRILYGKVKACGEVETDQESNGSSDDMDSPRSVARGRKVHSQILRIREEDSHIGDGIGEGLSTSKDHHHVKIVVFRRPILPASPLGGKTTAVKMVH